MNKKNIYWSYNGKPGNPSVIIEHVLKYEDVNEIKSLLKKYGTETCRSVWEKSLIPDKRYKKLNYFLAKFIFRISKDDNIISEYLKKHSKTRGEKLNEILNR